MSQAPRSRPVPVGLLVPSRLGSGPPGRSPLPGGRGAHSWLWPGLGVAALYPLFLASIGLLAVGLRPVPQTVTETASGPPVVMFAPTDPPASEAAAEPESVEPGEARPRPNAEPEVPPVPDPPPADPVQPPRCERFGTAVDFVRSPSVAARQAAREQKLVMVLHLAGNFEDPGFT